LLLDLICEETNVSHVDTLAVKNLGKKESVGNVKSRGTSINEESIEDDISEVLTCETNVLGGLFLFVVDLERAIGVLDRLALDESVRVEVELEIVGVDH
jgi:hypothetical protein